MVYGNGVFVWAFNNLLKVVSAEKVSTSAYVNPVIASFLGWYVLDEYISLQNILAVFILLMGVYFINSKKKFAIFNRFRNK
ncbi:EamA family transporter [Xanthomarina sp. GH4-25]|uniref:EamA family transporter n=1 Tax=Xanthomarina sp. GH4-25 TaxID=3349335 RepID=UPI0026D0765D